MVIHMKKKKKSEMFNPAFKDLKSKVKVHEEKAENVSVAQLEIPKAIIDDDLIFHKAMSDVFPISRDRVGKTPKPGKNIRPSHSVADEEELVIAHLRDLVNGSIDMDITFTDEYIEGAISGVGRKVMTRLKRGQLPIQDHIDLHGLTKKDAETAVRNFLIKSHGRGLRCVLIVHGRGLNSPDSVPVLKERLPVWLNRGPARKIVLAFATARPYDGGTGAIYVLLRK
jgi:DNA-nicking Smr family endonuclease